MRLIPRMTAFWAKVDRRNETECWPWLGATGRGADSGYGYFHDGSNSIGAHRVAFALFGGIVAPGQVIDHKCRNRLCVNPAHLEAVSVAENTLRGIGPTAVNASKASCHRGHPLAGHNLISRNGWRACRTCKNERDNLARRLARALAAQSQGGGR